MTFPTDSPIIVSGPGRSGSTWMQWFLSSLPSTHIHGQSPNIPWRTFWNWFCTLREQSQWAEHANARVGYETAHYAGSTPAATEPIFRRMLRDYLSGFGPYTARWGLKWIGLCMEQGSVEQWESLWPDTRWVVCLRDPFRTIESARNTFERHRSSTEIAENWVRACRFAENHDTGRVTIFQIDRLTRSSTETRVDALMRVATTIGLSDDPTRGVVDRLANQIQLHAQKWPVVHKDKPDKERTFALTPDQRRELLDQVADLQHYAGQLGYEPE